MDVGIVGNEDTFLRGGERAGVNKGFLGENSMQIIKDACV